MATLSENRKATAAASDAWRLIFQYFLSLDPYLDEIASEFGLTDSQGHALTLLEPGSGLPMHELAERLHCHASNVTAIVDALETRGLVERRPGERDRRVKIVALTDAGAELRKRALARLFRPPPGIAELSAEDQRTLRDIMRRVVGG